MSRFDNFNFSPGDEFEKYFREEFGKWNKWGSRPSDNANSHDKPPKATYPPNSAKVENPSNMEIRVTTERKVSDVFKIVRDPGEPIPTTTLRVAATWLVYGVVVRRILWQATFPTSLEYDEEQLKLAIMRGFTTPIESKKMHGVPLPRAMILDKPQVVFTEEAYKLFKLLAP